MSAYYNDGELSSDTDSDSGRRNGGEMYKEIYGEEEEEEEDEDRKVIEESKK